VSSDAGGGRLEVIALGGLPEVQVGDDLGELIGDALAATDGALPLRAGDVLVVTQKVVSKAEGAVADLRTVEPRPEAVAWADAWGRDPRQIEVVLQEARRIVRMERGVPHRTRHGFVARERRRRRVNVGPESGDLVTLLPATQTPRRPGSAPRCAAGSDTTSRSSSRTASAGRGGGASSTSRSACRACCRSTICVDSPMPTGG
jgi:coenzyme F420-0:L-glutamate ligase/coenzyme F420-1:gamma-L-glutamate ligase